jgi:1-acyl-sn-glycerol-3-phosphate acyltransferase
VRAAALDVRARHAGRTDWGRGPLATVVRSVLQALLLFPVMRWLGRPLRVGGRDRLESGPYVFVANHASHADTAALLAALPPRLRRCTAPAAAEDYFFTSRLRGAIVTLLTGAFPFPRRGRAGLWRAEALLRRGWSIVLFPEGTRSCDGRVHEFKGGAALLARRGWSVVPVGIAGARDVLPKGGRLPARSPVTVVFGNPLRLDDSGETTRRLEESVRVLAAEADRRNAPPRVSMHDRVASFARSPRALALCAAWGLAEALYFPVIPDFAVVALALAAPARALPLALCAAAGSIAGGAFAYHVGASSASIAAHLPLVTEPMSAFARDALAAGPEGLLRQPLSGVPYKAFAYQAPAAGVDALSFVWFSVLARAGRLVAVAGVSAVLGVGARRIWRRVYGGFLVVYTACFVVGLGRVVASWS